MPGCLPGILNKVLLSLLTRILHHHNWVNKAASVKFEPARERYLWRAQHREMAKILIKIIINKQSCVPRRAVKCTQKFKHPRTPILEFPLRANFNIHIQTHTHTNTFSDMQRVHFFTVFNPSKGTKLAAPIPPI